MTAEINLFDASVPVFGRYLAQLDRMLDKAQAHVAEQRIDPQTVLQARLAPDMFPLALQAEITVNFVYRACAPLAGLAVPAYGVQCGSFAALKTRIAQASAFLATLTPEQMLGSAGRRFASQAGDSALSLDGTAFLLHYALPNFLFHVAMVYAILRRLGVPLGKADYDGFHVYARPA